MKYKKIILTLLITFTLFIGEFGVFAEMTQAKVTKDITQSEVEEESEPNKAEVNKLEDEAEVRAENETPGSDLTSDLLDPLFEITYNGQKLKPDETIDLTLEAFKSGEYALHFNWQLPNTTVVKPNDTIEFDLPDIFSSDNKDPKDAMLDGVKIGTYYFENNKVKLVFEFDPNEVNQDFKGGITELITVKQDVIVDSGKTVIKDPFSEKEIAVINIDKPNQTYIDKTGAYSHDEKHEVIWTFKINEKQDAFEAIQFEDEIPHCLLFDKSNVSVVNKTNKGTAHIDTNIEGNRLEIDFKNSGNGKNRDEFEVIVVSKIDFDCLTKDGKKLEDVAFINDVKVKIDEKEAEASASVPVSFKDPLTKANTDYKINEKGEHVYTWKIVFNPNRLPLNDVKFTDHFDADILELVDDSFKMLVNDAPSDVYKNNIAFNDSGFVFDKSGVFSDKLEIEYELKIKEGVYRDDIGSLLNNKITYEEKTTTYPALGYNNTMFNKDFADIDYEKGIITWKIVVNEQHDRISDLSIIDDLASKGHTILEDVLVEAYKNNQETVENPQYKTEIKEGKLHIYLNEGQETDSKYVITLKSKFDLSSPEALDQRAFNTATLDFKHNGNDKTVSSQDQTDLYPDHYLQGRKIGSYDANTKLFTWHIFTNFNKNSSKTKIKDSIDEGLELIQNERGVHFEMTSYDPSKINDLDYLNSLKYQDLDKNVSITDNDFNIELIHQEDTSLVIRYQTKLNTHDVKSAYENNADLTNDKGRTTQVSSTVPIPEYETSKVQKTGKQVSGQDAALWELVINHNQAQITDLKVYDEVDSLQSYIRDSLEIYKLVFTQSGAIDYEATYQDNNKLVGFEADEKDISDDFDYLVSFIEGKTDDEEEQESFVIDFKPNKSVDEAYIIRYKTLFHYPETVQSFKLSNKSKVTGSNIDHEEYKNGDFQNSIEHKGASWGSAKKGSIKINKFSQEPRSQALNNVKFVLQKQTDNAYVTLRKATTNELGELEFTGIYPGTYRIIETETYEGYVKATLDFVVEADGSISGLDEDFSTTSIDKNKLSIINNRRVIKFTKNLSTNEEMSKESYLELIKEAQFELYALDDNDKIAEKLDSDKLMRIDESGNMVFDYIDQDAYQSGLLPGRYMIKEIKAPQGFILNTKPVIFTVEPDRVYNEVFLDNYKGTVKLQKINETGKALEGAVFNLHRSSDQKVIKESIISDQKGMITVTDLEPGQYFLQEVKAPSGYDLDNKKIPFEIKDKSNGKPEILDLGQFTNHASRVEIKKVNEALEPLKGAEFELYHDGIKLDKKFVSNDRGLIQIENLELGSFELKEIKAPDSYVVNTNSIKFKVIDGMGVVYEDEREFINYKGRFELFKQDENGGALKDAEFTLYDSKGTPLETVYSDEKGLVQFDQLAPGHYEVKETKAPSGYLLNSETISFEIKSESDSKPIVSVTSFINYKGSIIFNKKNDKGAPLQDAKFKLVDTSGHEFFAVSDALGQVRFENLSPNSYVLTELEAPQGYALNPQVIEVEIPKTADEKVEIALDDFINYSGAFTLQKVDEKGHALEQVEFSLYNEKNDLIQSVKSNEAGLVLFEDLAPGDYTVRETGALNGFILNNKTVQFTISDILHAKQTLNYGQFINYKGAISITKVNEAHEPLSGASFALYTSEGEHLGDQTSNDEGIVLFDKLSPGTYILKETQAPEGYVLDTKEYIVIIDESHLNKQTTALTIKNYQASVSFAKKDHYGNVLSGAEFALLNDRDEVMQTIKSNAQGIVLFENLAPGTYSIKEKQAAFDYIKNTKRMSFTVLDAYDGKQVIELSDFINYKQDIVLEKIDENSELILDTASFNLLDQDKNIIAKNLKTKQGRLLIKDLSGGTYYLQETKAPKHYKLDEKLLKFEVASENYEAPDVLHIQFINKLDDQSVLGEQKLPATGKSHQITIYAIGFILVGLLEKRYNK